jgi:type VI secretion system protein ImpL
MKLSFLIPAVAVWIGLSAAIAILLKVHDTNFWIVVAGLSLIGVLAALAFWWFGRRRGGTARSTESLDEKDELELLFREAEARLAKSQLGSTVKLINLPIFLVMGERGSTKTTIVLNSGLEPELIAGQVYQDSDVIPTKVANVWFARNHLLIEATDTVLGVSKRWNTMIRRVRPGRLSTVSSRQHAPRAALVCFDTEVFFRSGGAESSIVAARKLHARLNELSERLGISFPVYVLFTRADRVSFFLDFVANLTNLEAAQVFGATLPALSGDSRRIYTEEQSSRLAEAFDTLYFSLCAKRPEFLSRENDQSKLPGAYEFPREFRKLRNGIVQFLVELCRPSQLTSGPFLRGFYFTGVRPVVVNQSPAAPVRRDPEPQRTRPAADATSILRPVQQLQQRPVEAQPAITQRRIPQWVFLGRLFTEVLLADRDALASSSASTQTSTARRIWLAVGTAVFLLLSIGFVVSFVKNRELEDRVVTAVRGISPAEASGSDLPSLESLTRLENLRQSVETLSEYNSNGAPLSLRCGLYTGDSLYPPARRLYFDKFQQLLVASTQRNLLNILRGLPSSPGPTDDYQYAYDTLKAYLITTSHHEKSTQLYLAPVLLNRWLAGRTIDRVRLDLARRQFNFYAEELKAANPFSPENDSASLERARHYLSQFAGAERVYHFMVSEANKTNPGVSFNLKFPGSSAVVADSYEVPGAFTKNGWKVMQDNLKQIDRFFNGEQWVLGDQTSANFDFPKLQSDLSARYTSDFLENWRNYLKHATVVAYRSIPDAAQKLSRLSSPQSPLLEMFWLASQNTSVENRAVNNAFKPLYAVMPPSATDQYIVPANDGYMKALAALQISVEQIAQQLGAPSDATASQTLSAAQNAKLITRQMAQNFGLDPAAHLEATVEKLMEDPITYTESLLRGLGPAELNGKGKSLCAQLSSVLTKFPFNAVSKIQATVSDVNSIFKPKEGVLWSFYDQNLSKHLIRTGPRYIPDPSSPIRLNPVFVAFFNRAASFSDLAYVGGSADPHFSYDVKPILSEDIQSLKLTIDGQTADFGADTPAKSFGWQPAGAHGVQLSGKYKGGTDFLYPTYDGLWAVFEWVGDADIQQGSTLEWKLKAGNRNRPVLSPVTNQPVVVRFSIGNPVFQKGYFRGMTCISEIAKP